MAEGGGTGITTMPVLQSLSQARARWGDHNAGAIWDASIVKIVLGGASVAKDLQDISALLGEHDGHVPRQVVGRISSLSKVGMVGSASPRCTSIGRFQAIA